MKRKLDVQVACGIANVTGESPVWSVRHQALFWVDIRGGKLHRLTEAGEVATWNIGQRIGAVGFRKDGGLIATLPDGVYALNVREGGAFTLESLAKPELAPDVRLKEGKVAPDGSYWCGSTGPDLKTRRGSLFRLAPDGRFETVDEGFILVNGLAFSPDRKLLMLSDSPDDRVYAYQFDPTTGGASNRRDFFSTAEFPGVIDGATFDSEGGFWGAFIYDWSVGRIDAEGRLDRMVRLPVRHPTMCAFGGRELDVLYVTSATSHLKEEEKAAQPESGKLLSVRGLGVSGVAEPEFGA